MLGTLQRQKIGGHWHQDQVGGEHGVQRKNVEQRTAVQDDWARRHGRSAKRFPQAGHDVHALAQQRIELRQLQVRRAQDHTTLRELCDVREPALPHEEAVQGVVGEPGLHAEDMRKMALRIEVDAQRPRLALGDGGEQVECGRGLADAALLVEDCDDRHAAEDTLSSAGPSPRLCKRVAKAAPETAPRALAYHLALSYDLPAQRRDPRRRAGQAHAFGAAESLAPAGRPAARRPCPGRRAHAFPARDRRRHRFRRRFRAGRDRRARRPLRAAGSAEGDRRCDACGARCAARRTA